MSRTMTLGLLIIMSAHAQAGNPAVDLLLVIDNSNGMSEEQAVFANELPQFFARLTSGDVDQSGDAEFEPITDLQVSVITSDMGSGGHVVPTCSAPLFGDDGLLQTSGETLPGCASSYPAIQTYTGDSDALADGVSCVARQGVDGCGFEQPLDAALKAITPSTSSIRFFNETVGHGDGANVGFVREDSLLVVVVLSNENDCSAADPDLFNPTGGPYSGVSLSLRCYSFPEALHPVQRLVDGLIELRPDPRDIVFTLVAGIPPSLIDETPNFEAILDDPAMQESIDAENPDTLAPSCTDASTGSATPPVRGVTTAQQLSGIGASVVLGSVCQGSYNTAMTRLVLTIARRLQPLIFRDSFESS